MSLRKRYRLAVTKKGGDGYTVVPSCLLGGQRWKLGDKPMEFKHRTLLIAFLSFNYRDGWFKVGSRALKDVAGLGNEAITSATKDLVEAGLLKVSRVPNCTNEYSLDGFYSRFLEEASPLGEAVSPSRFELPDDVREAIARE